MSSQVGHRCSVHRSNEIILKHKMSRCFVHFSLFLKQVPIRCVIQSYSRDEFIAINADLMQISVFTWLKKREI